MHPMVNGGRARGERNLASGSRREDVDGGRIVVCMRGDRRGMSTSTTR